MPLLGGESLSHAREIPTLPSTLHVASIPTGHANPYSILAGPGGEGPDTLGSLVGRLVRAARSVLLQWQPGENLTVLGGSGLQVNRRL